MCLALLTAASAVFKFSCPSWFFVYILHQLVHTLESGDVHKLSDIRRLPAQAAGVVAAYLPFFDDVHVEREDRGWALITGTRKQH